MDMFDELENLAVSAAYEEPEENEGIYDPIQGTVKMWQDRFGYTYEEAAAIIRITKNATKPSTLTQQTLLSRPSVDPADPHADFAALYLQKGLDTSPIGYMTDLLKENIDEGIKQGKRCVIVDEFPRSVKQLRGFEEKIQAGNLVLLLTSVEAIQQRKASPYAIRTFQELEDQQAEKLVKKIDCDGSKEDVYASLKEAAEAFIGQAGKK